MIESNLTAWWITAGISGVLLLFATIKLFIDLRNDRKRKQDSKNIESNLKDIYKEILCKDCYERLNSLLVRNYLESKKDSIKS